MSIANHAIIETPPRGRRPRLTPDEQRELARLYTDENASPTELRIQFGIGAPTLYRLLRKQGVALRGRSASAPQARKADGDHLVAAQNTAPVRGRVRSGSAKASPRVQTAHRSTNGASIQFRVTFTAVQILQAADIRGALHQAGTLGATDVLEITQQV